MSSNSIYTEETRLQTPLAYVYKITNKTTGEFYIGSRFCKSVRESCTLENDFLKRYFTSGKLKDDIENNLHNYEGEILFRSNETVYVNGNDQYLVIWYEQLLIRENIKNLLCKNKKYFDVDLSKLMWFVDNTGRILTPDQRKDKGSPGEKNGMYGKQQPIESRKIMSDKKKLLIGPLHPRYGKPGSMTGKKVEPVTINGKTYRSKNAACKDLGINYYNLSKLI